MATAKRSKLELDESLANMVEDVTDISARAAGHSLTDSDKDELVAARNERIELIVKEHGVPRPIAIIMADSGYSKGTANRIYNDQQKRARQAREAAQASAQAKGAKQPQANVA